MGYLNKEYNVDFTNINFLSYAKIYALAKQIPGNLNDRQRQLLADSMVAIYQEYNILSGDNIFKNFSRHLKSFENKKNHSKAYGMTSIDSDSKEIFISLDESKFYDDKGQFMEDKYCRAMIHELLHAASARLETDNQYNGLSHNENTYLDEIATVYFEDKIFNKYFSNRFQVKETSTIYKVDDFFAMKTRNSFVGYDYINEYAKGLDLLEDGGLDYLYFSNQPGYSLFIDNFSSNYKSFNSALDFSYRPTINRKEAIMQTNYIFFNLVKDKIRTMGVEEYLVFSYKLKETMNINFLEKEKRQSINVIDESIKNMDIYYFYNVAKKDNNYKNFIPSDLFDISSKDLELQKMYAPEKDVETKLFLEKINNLRKPNASLINAEEIQYVLKNIPILENRRVKNRNIQEVIKEELKSQYLVFSNGISKTEKSLKNCLELSSLTIDSRHSKFKGIFDDLRKNERLFKIKNAINIDSDSSFFIDVINNVNDYRVFEIILDESLKIAKDANDSKWIRAMLNNKVEIGEFYLSPIEYCAKQSKYEFLNIIFEKTWDDIYIDKIKIFDINNFVKAQYYYEEKNKPWLNVVDMKNLDDSELKLLPFTIAKYGKDIDLIKRDLSFISEQAYSNVLNGVNEEGKYILDILIERKFDSKDILSLYMDNSLKLKKEPKETFENLVEIVINNNPDKLLEIEKKIGLEYIDYNSLMADFVFDENTNGIKSVLLSDNVNLLSNENFYYGFNTLIKKRENEIIKDFVNGIVSFNESQNNIYFYSFLTENLLRTENYEMLNYLVKEKNVSFELIQECLLNEFNNSKNNEKNLETLYNIFRETNDSLSATISLMGISIAYEDGKFTKKMFKENSPIEIFGDNKEVAIECINHLKNIYNNSHCLTALAMDFKESLDFYNNLNIDIEK